MFVKRYLVRKGTGTTESHGRKRSEDVSYDVGGATVLPGFIDTHVHLISNAEADPTNRMKASDEYLVLTAHKNAMTSLRSGFTTLCDKGSRNTVTLQLRRAITDSVVPGPRLLVCGRVITPTGGHSYQTGGREADGPTKCRHAAREQLKAGADLKVIATWGVLTKGSDPNAYQFNTDEMQAVAEEAHKVGKRVAAHALSSRGIANAVATGIDTIEHASLADKETIALMGEHQVPWVTTISAAKHNAESRAQPWIREKAEANIRRKRLIVQYAQRSTTSRLCLGRTPELPVIRMETTPTNSFISLENGLTEMEAILAGTYSTVEALGIEADVGTIEPGKSARGDLNAQESNSTGLPK